MAKPRPLSSQRLYSGRLLALELVEVQDPAGRIHEREIVHHPGAVAIVPFLDEKVLLVRQYRAPIGKELWEIPAGKIEPGEEPIECAKRELIEEVGYKAREWQKLVEFYTTPGFCDERMTLFLARELEPVTESKQAEDEFIQVRGFALPELEEMLRRGELEDAKTIIGLAMVLALAAGEGRDESI
ncbi:MAG: NUDIX hydrolase [Candidatus Bipolaricaulia bacterium]